MAKVDKIVELINRYKQELKEHYKMEGKLEERRDAWNGKMGFEEGLNMAYIKAKEHFIQELEELKEYYSYD
jgi:hypothetical protein|nr:MAG TPA: hypothetical protein [Caudoviricetes sp.]